MSLLLQVSKGSEETASDGELIVMYLSAGHTYTMTLDFTLVLCAADDTTTKHCQ